MLVNAKSILVKSKLPGADYVINPYIGCLNACTYCYAKFMLRFQRHWNEWGKFVDVKINAPGLLPTKSLKGKKVLMSSVTDPYQAVEKKYELTRKILKQLIPLQPSLFILTKSDLVLRDIDLLKQFKDCIVCFSMAFDENVRKRLEPGAQPLQRRVKALKKLRKAGIKAGIFIAPLIPGVTNWKKLVEETLQLEKVVQIAIVGKYTALEDSYISIVEALKHGGISNKTKINLKWVNAEDLEKETNIEPIFRDVHGIVVPGGFGPRGIEGKIKAIRYVRENKIPFLGLCLGMQCAVIEFARNVCKMKGANSSEFAPETKYPVIDLLPGQKNISDKGGTMRLGAYPCKIKKDTLLHQAYKKEKVSERHRHRYEVNNEFRQELGEAGLIFSGIYPKADLVEVIEVKDHPWFLATQYHPEFKSRPTRPHPLFEDLIKAATEKLEEQVALFNAKKLAKK